MSMLTDAIWEQRIAVRDYAPRLRELRELVRFPGDMLVQQWAHLYALVHQFKPDLIVELGRGGGNSTALFTDCANQLHSKVLSVGFDGTHEWEKGTTKRLSKMVPASWFLPLEAVHADIMEFDFSARVREAARVFLLWDAHGYELAYHVLGNILPLLATVPHIVVVHDIADARYTSPPRDYCTPNGTPTYWAGHFVSSFEEVIAITDFLSRNGIVANSADEDTSGTLAATRSKRQQVWDLWEPAYGDENPLTLGGFLYFAMYENEADPSRLIFPDKALPCKLISRAHDPVRPEDFRIRQLIRAMLTRLLSRLRHSRARQ